MWESQNKFFFSGGGGRIRYPILTEKHQPDPVAFNP